ncbi:MAG: hypothetical protein E7553_02270 [Ruminococcaceae bacterium]|nr:hypothetical protein [Oscillospiraceae bacterium]
MEYMSGSQLRQYLHISTRKMKYLMDHNLIPHENTGGTTHKYRVRVEDAEAFKVRMETDAVLIAALTGQFSSHKNERPKPYRPPINADAATAEAFRLWLTARWAELPDALPAVTAAKLCGSEAKVITKLVRDKRIRGTVVGHVMLCVKADWIAWLASVEMIATNKNEVYVGLMKEFKRQKRRKG